jgi:hypothetical protein
MNTEECSTSTCDEECEWIDVHTYCTDLLRVLQNESNLARRMRVTSWNHFCIEFCPTENESFVRYVHDLIRIWIVTLFCQSLSPTVCIYVKNTSAT